MRVVGTVSPRSSSRHARERARPRSPASSETSSRPRSRRSRSSSTCSGKSSSSTRSRSTTATTGRCTTSRLRCRPRGGSVPVRRPHARSSSSEMPAGSEYDPIAPMLALADAAVDFVVIGGVAAQIHGSAQLTFDLDVAYARTDANLSKLADVLRSMNARLRGAPPDVPFQLDARTLRAGANFTFVTDHGSVDILGDPAGAPRYDRLRA